MTDRTTVVVAGSRSIKNHDAVSSPLYDYFPTRDDGKVLGDGYEILTGGANGVDQLAETWADRQNPPIPTRTLRPDYDAHPPKIAPLKRNETMAEQGDVLIAVWDGESNGTKHMIDNALERGLETHVHVTD